MKFKIKNKSKTHKKKSNKKRKYRKFISTKSKKVRKENKKEKEKEKLSEKRITDDNNNTIEIRVKISEENINKKIYLLCKNKITAFYEGRNDYIQNHLNKKEIKIYLNEKENNFTYNNYSIFTEKGDFNIKIKFSIIIDQGYRLFSGCENITHIDFSNFKTNLMTNFSYLFFNCYNLKTINFANFDTSKMTNMKYMFFGCQNLKEIKFNCFDTSNVTDAIGLFGNCKSLVNLDITGFDFKNLKKMDYMFQGCDNLENIIVSEKLFNQIGELLKNYNITIIYS